MGSDRRLELALHETHTEITLADSGRAQPPRELTRDAQQRSRAASRQNGSNDDDDLVALTMTSADVDQHRRSDRPRGTPHSCPGPAAGASDAPIPGGLAIRRSEDGSRLVLTLCGELDLGSTPTLQRELSATLSGDYRQIMIDLTELDFIDSRGLVALMHAQNAAQSRRKAFSLRRGGRQVQRLFDVTGYGARFTFEE